MLPPTKVPCAWRRARRPRQIETTERPEASALRKSYQWRLQRRARHGRQQKPTLETIANVNGCLTSQDPAQAITNGQVPGTDGMSEKPTSNGRAESQRVRKAIGRLAAVRETIAWEPSLVMTSARPNEVPSPSVARSPDSQHESMLQDLADIEAASHALRRAEPTLTNWTAPEKSGAPPRSNVWIVFALIWTPTTFLIGGAIAAIVHFIQ